MENAEEDTEKPPVTNELPETLPAEASDGEELSHQQSNVLFDQEDLSHEEDDEIDEDQIAELEKRFGGASMQNNASGTSSSSFRRSSFRMSVRSSLTVAHDSMRSAVPPENAISQVLAAAFVVNYVGAGYILLPYGFAQSGPLLGVIVTALVCLQAYCTSSFVLESCRRMNFLQNPYYVTINSVSEHYPKKELPDLTKFFMGKKWTYFFTATTCLDLYAISWTFCSVFAQAMADELPLKGLDVDDYKFYVLIFILIAVRLSCTSILDQMFLQMIFLAGRLIMVLFMIGTLIHAFANPNQVLFDDHPDGPSPPKLFRFSGLLTVIQLAVFSTAFQFSVPGISNITAVKKRHSQTFQYAITFIFVSNVLLSLLVSIYFGPDGTEPSSNLNWVSYSGNQAVAKYIVLFAALDGLAVYPLMTLSLGDILLHTFFSHRSAKEIDEILHQDWKTRTAFRLVASIPQAVAAIFMSDLPALASLGVIFTLLSYTVCPCLLHLVSSGKVHMEGDRSRHNNKYDGVSQTLSMARENTSAKVDGEEKPSKTVSRSYSLAHMSRRLSQHVFSLRPGVRATWIMDWISYLLLAVTAVIIGSILVTFSMGSS